jgi:hypothetical protein
MTIVCRIPTMTYDIARGVSVVSGATGLCTVYYDYNTSYVCRTV